MDAGLAGKRVLLLGGSGFIGSRVATLAHRAGARVRIASRHPELARVPPAVERRPVDVAFPSQALDDAVADSDIVVNLAGRSGPLASVEDPTQDLSTNVLGSLHVLEAARGASPSPRVVFTSSRLVYGRPQQLPVTLDHPTVPTSMYGIHKLAAEGYHRIFHDLYQVPTTVLRLTNPYGPRRPGVGAAYGIVNYFLERALRDEDVPVYGDGEQTRDYVYVDDVVLAILSAGVHPDAPGRTWNVGGGQPIPVREMARAVVEACGRGRVTRVPWPEDYARVETGSFLAEIGTTRQELGWSPTVPLADGLARTVAHYRAGEPSSA